jgi:aspartyl protease family protein
MRSIIWIVALTVALGVLVARYADKALNAPTGKSDSSEAITTRSSSVTTVTVPSSAPESSSASGAPTRPALPEIIRMSPSSSSSRTVTLRGDRDGQFRVDARVDTRRLAFIVDTGAGAVTLRASDAAKLGIHPMERDYTIKTQTANGVGRAAPVRLNMIEIENIVVRDVVAIVVPDTSLKENLLGMTFLSRVRWMHDRNRLVIEQ